MWGLLKYKSQTYFVYVFLVEHINGRFWIVSWPVEKRLYSQIMKQEENVCLGSMQGQLGSKKYWGYKAKVNTENVLMLEKVGDAQEPKS